MHSLEVWILASWGIVAPGNFLSVSGRILYFRWRTSLVSPPGRGSLEPESSSSPQEAQALVQPSTCPLVSLCPVGHEDTKPTSVPFSQLLFLLLPVPHLFPAH